MTSVVHAADMLIRALDRGAGDSSDANAVEGTIFLFTIPPQSGRQRTVKTARP